jgi:plastocyanin
MHIMGLVAPVAAPTWIQRGKEAGMRRISGLLGALILALGVVSCGGGGGYTTGTGGGGGGGGTCPAGTFCMTSSTFTPTSRTVTVGSTVTWQNGSAVGHNIVWDDATGRAAAVGGDGTGDMPNFDAGMSHTRKFNTAGTYGFHCTIHPGMTATLTVQ